MNSPNSSRVEEDSLGKISVPINALFGAQTQRALENFNVTGHKPWWGFIAALILIKKSAAKVNAELGLLDKKISQAILDSANEVLKGDYRDSFPIDPIQAGAGTSLNMNVNEVIANLATLNLGGTLGEYLVHPNDHVNMAQSTNDTIPTAMRVGSLMQFNEVSKTLMETIAILEKKAEEFSPYIKSGRTHLQDAVPIRFGHEFQAFADILKRDHKRMLDAAENLKNLPIGGTAVGSGLNAHPDFHKKMVSALSSETNISFQTSDNLFESMQSMADFVAFSGSFRVLAISMTKIANDLRLLSSGPNTGLGEIKLKPVQPGSSIMPGKVNPVMAEMMNMAMFHIMGSDTTISLAAQAGQLELNVMMPIIGHHLFEILQTTKGAFSSINERCLREIKPNPKMIDFWLRRNPIIITALNPIIGYEQGASIVRIAQETGESVQRLAIRMADNGRLMDIRTGETVSPITLREAFANIEKMTEGGIL